MVPSQAITSVSQQQQGSAVIVPSAEELQKIEQASAAASEVTNTVLTQRLQLEEKERSIKMLQKALVSVIQIVSTGGWGYLEQASAAASEVTNTVLTQKRSIKMLQKSLVSFTQIVSTRRWGYLPFSWGGGHRGKVQLEMSIST